MLNVVSIAGRLVKDPNLRNSKNGSVVNFDLAVETFSKVMFFRFVAYSKTAEHICKYCHKGDKIAITGSLETYSYVSKNDETQTRVQIKVNTVEFMGKHEKASSESTAYEKTQEDNENNPVSTTANSAEGYESFEKFLSEL